MLKTTYKLTKSMSIFLLEKLTVTQVDKTFRSTMDPKSDITSSTRARHRSLSRAR